MTKHARIVRIVRDYAVTAAALAGAIYLTIGIALSF